MKLNIRYILLYVFCFSLVWQSNGNDLDVRKLFFTEVVSHYKAQTVKLHQYNLGIIDRNHLDSLRTEITIDFSNWKFNTANNHWQYAGAPPEDPAFPFSAAHYFYKRDFQTGTTQSEVSLTSSTHMEEYNKYQLEHPTELGMRATLLYNVNIINLPLFVVNKSYDNFEADTNATVYETLRKLEYTDDEKWKCFLSENNELGQSIFTALNTFKVSTPPYFIMVFNSYSETISFKNKDVRFRYFNYYAHDNVDDNLDKSLKINLQSFLYNPATTTDLVLESFIATLKCELLDDCSGVAGTFQTQNAIDFWAEFEIAAPLRSSTYFDEHKLRAIEIATRIDGLPDTNQSGPLSRKGMCYLDSYYCNSSNLASTEGVRQASTIALNYFQSSLFTPVLNQTEVKAAIISNASNIKFKVAQMSSDAQAEIEFEFSSLQSKEILKTSLTQLGLNFKNSYGYWLFYTDREDTYGNYFYWLDNEYNKTPPTVLIIFASIATGPAGAVYGWVTGTDMITGAELTGLDYVLNVFDLIPAIGILGELGSGFFKTVKLTRLGKTFTLAGNATGMYKAYHGAVKAFKTSATTVKNVVYKSMTWGINATFNEIDKVLVLMNKTGDEIGKIFSNKIEFKSNQLLPVTPGGQVMPIGNNVDIYVDGQKTTAKYELVKKEDGDFGVRVVSEIAETVRGVTKTNFKATFEASEELKEQAWNLFKQEKWADLENLINTNDINGLWPPNGGFIDIEITSIEVGFEFDRYGGKIIDGNFVDNGNYVSPKGASFESRALPSDYLTSKPYKKYKVLKKIENVKKGKSIPWFGQEGKGIQFNFDTNINIDYLKDLGYIEEI